MECLVLFYRKKMSNLQEKIISLASQKLGIEEETGREDYPLKEIYHKTKSGAQIDALLIAKSLVNHTKKLEKVFLDYDRQLIVADVRRKETYKPGDSKARKKRQKSYR